MRNWAEMITEMLSLICKRVSCFEDLAAFGGVCSTWRHAAVNHNLGQPLLPFPWLMLAEKQHPDHRDYFSMDEGKIYSFNQPEFAASGENQNDDHREFYSLTEGKTYRFDLPELRGKKCMETKGWIVTASNKGEMALVHPLTRVTIPLPHQNTSRSYAEHPMDELIFVSKAVLSSPPDPNNERDSVLMIVLGGMQDLGFCRLGDKVWTIIENPTCATRSLEYYRGKFYGLIAGRRFGVGVLEVDVIRNSDDTSTVSQRRIKVDISPKHLHFKEPYLVESAGSLLVVTRNGVSVDDDGNYGTTEFCVFEIDVEQGSHKAVESLGTKAIFISHSAPLSIDTIFYPELIPNSIYFADDCIEAYLSMSIPKPEGGGTNMGVYNLEDKSVRPHYSGKSLSFVCPPVWTFLTTIPMRSRK